MFMSRRWVCATICLLGCAAVTSASAAVFNVNTTVDAIDNDTSDGVCLIASGGCSLRAAVQQANANSEADEINVPAGLYNLSVLGAEEDAGESGDLDILSGSEITINGAGADDVVIDGMREDRVLHVLANATLTLNGVTVRNGSLGQSSSGGGINNTEGRLTVNDSHITGNITFGQGGGISNFRGTLEVNRSVVSGNLALSTGGGIMNQDGDATINYTTIRANMLSDSLVTSFGGGIYNSALFNTLVINNSTISDHRVFLDGGAIYHLIGNLRITNTTLSGNTATRYGGGLFYSSGNSNFGMSSGGNRLVNVTITDNTAFGIDSSDDSPSPGGGGVYVRGAVPLNLVNTIVADNNTGGDCSNDGALISLGNNLDSDASCELDSDVSSISGGVAALISLTDNGGPTLTHALDANSDAIDAADNSLCPAIDQRGYERSDGSCDIGAFESSAVAPLNVVSAPLLSNQQVSSENSPPEASGALLTADAGATVSSSFAATDVDGDPLSFEIVQAPQLGSVGLGGPGSHLFTYSARPDAAGSDRFTFRACDDSGACSAAATINVSITNAPVSSDIIIQVAPGSGTIAGEKQITLPDVDYSQPLGVFRFSVENVPTDPDANLNGTVVTIRLPVDAQIASDAVIRKLNINQVWETLGAGPDPQVTTGTIDRVTKTITLVLRDNDRFDLNRSLGVIEDPIALAVQGAGEGVQDAPSDSSDPTPATDGSATSDVSLSNASRNAPIVGGGGLHPLWLAVLGVVAGVCRGRRR